MEVHLPAHGNDGVPFGVLDLVDLEFRAGSPLSLILAHQPLGYYRK
jgi:hypothetical protein